MRNAPFTTSDESDEVVAAFFAAVDKVENVRKTKTVDTGKYEYKHATLDDVLAAVEKACADEGLVFTMLPSGHEAHWTMTAVFWHTASSQWLALPPYVRPEVRDEQGFGSAQTYARRYLLMSVFNLAPEDDDGKAATDMQRNQQQFAGNRTADELAIRQIIGLWPAEVRKPLVEDFKARFQAGLTDLAVNKHADALAWMLEWRPPKPDDDTPAPRDDESPHGASE